MKTLSTLDNEEAREVAQTIICDIADQIEVIQDSMTLIEEESYSFVAILKNIKESQSEEARELLAFMLGISSLDLDLHIQDIIDEKFNSED